MISPALVEEFLEDTKTLARQLVQYGDRWSKIGPTIEKHASESQRADIKQALDDLLFAIEHMQEGSDG